MYIFIFLVYQVDYNMIIEILNETDDFVTGMKIVKEEDGTFTYNRIKLASRGTNADKYLLYPIKQTEVAKMLKHTGANWQNPGW